MPSEAAAGRGRRLHPLTVVFAATGIARSMIWPAIAGGVGVGGRLDAALPIFLAVLAIPALIGAAVKYARYRWHLTAEELVLESGLLNRRNRVIPFARVQNVEVRQGPVQRVFGVAELRVETAGSGREAEAVLSVLSVEDAQGARAELLAGRRGAAAAAPPSAADEAEPPLARLSTGDVLLAGATANEAGVIAAALAGLLQFADGIPFPLLESAADEVARRTQGAMLLTAAMLVAAFLVLGWIISIGGAVLRYHGFTLRRSGDELRKRYGLLTVHEGSVPLERVQAVRVEESILRQALGCASLQVETAGGAPGQRGGAEAFVPLAAMSDVPRLVRGVFSDAALEGVVLTRVHPRARLRMARRGLLTLLVLWAPFWVARHLDLHPAGALAPWLALLLPVPLLMAGWQYRNRGWALQPGYLLARSGVMNRVTWIVPDRKLQTLHLRATPFQRRLGLATLVVDTAAGGRQAAIVDLAEPVARELLDTLRDRVSAAGRASPGPTAFVAGETPVPEGLPDAAAENFVVHATWVQAHAAGMEAGGAGGVVVADSGMRSDTFNVACRARLGPADAPARVREVVARFRSRGLPFAWWVGPGDGPPELASLLRGAGLARKGRQLAMWARLEAVRPGELSPAGLRIARVRRPDQLAEFAAVLAASWTPPDPEVLRFYDAAAPVLLAEGTPLRLYLGYLGSVPVATSALVVGGGVVGIYDVATREAYRGRGFGTAMTLQPLLDAREEGARTAVLQASPEGAEMCRRLGFEPYGVYVEYGPPEGG